jgi:hypothetical protein
MFDCSIVFRGSPAGDPDGEDPVSDRKVSSDSAICCFTENPDRVEKTAVRVLGDPDGEGVLVGKVIQE